MQRWQRNAVWGAPMLGRIIGHYEIIEKLGEGGMGVVYKAKDRRLDRCVALKLLPADKIRDQERSLRFMQEAKAASALNHPNIITIHDIETFEEAPVIVMEFIDGKTLDTIIPNRGLPLSTALKYSIQIADALARAHSVGIIHRDLKPSNIMVDKHGLVKVLDFGLAKLTEAEPSGDDAITRTKGATDPGIIVGTASYMSPEQAEGKGVDARSDIFSFGAVLYEMISGRRAFQGDSKVSTLTAVLREEPKSIEGMPRDLEKAISRCLRKDPSRRFQTMADLRVSLEELREDSESGALTAAPASRPARKLPWVWITAAAAAFCAAVLAVIWFLSTRPSGNVENLTPIPLTSYAGNVNEPSFSPDGNHVAFSWTGEKQDNIDIYIKLVGPGAPLRLTTHPAIDHCPVWSPDGRWIAFVRNLSSAEAEILLIPALGGPERKVAEGMVGSWICWSREGQFLFVSRRETPEGGNGIFRLSIATGEMRRLTQPPAEAWSGDLFPALSPDGRTLAFARSLTRSNSEIYLLPLTANLDGEGEPRRLTYENQSSAQPAWTPDGKRIIFASGGRGAAATAILMMIPSSASGEKAIRAPIGEGGESPAISPQGKLAYVRWVRDENIWRLDFSGGRPGTPRLLIASTRRDNEPRLSPDGKKIEFSSDRSGTTEVWVCDADGKNQMQLTNFHAGITSGARWSPDGRRFAFVSNREGQMDVYVMSSDGGNPQPLTKHRAHDTAPSWSRDAKWIYFASNREDDFQVWKMAPDPNATPVRVTRHGGYAAIESADGKTLFYAKRSGGAQAWALWQMPVAGGEETMLIPAISTWGDFDVTSLGIYYIDSALKGGRLRMLRFAGQLDSVLCTLVKRVSFGVAAAPDNSFVLFTRFDQETTELMLVENFLR